MSTMDPTRAANPPENAGGPATEVTEPATRAAGAGVLLHATSGEAGETARRILAATDIARAANCVGLRRRIEEFVADSGGRRGSGAVRWSVAGARARPVSRSDRRSRLRPAGDRHRTRRHHRHSDIARGQRGSGRAGPHDQSVHPSVAGVGSPYSTSPVSASSALADTTARRPRLADTRPSLFN